jgi:hypothetical protein
LGQDVVLELARRITKIETNEWCNHNGKDQK